MFWNPISVYTKYYVLKNKKIYFKFISAYNEGPYITILKKFQVKNMGPLPLKILHVVIDDQVCEGYGFKIVNCFEFENILQPNASQEIVIRFFLILILNIVQFLHVKLLLNMLIKFKHFKTIFCIYKSYFIHFLLVYKI